ncbi:FAD-dependent oxidoreductase [Phytohabitans suffuscus]|uniref:ferredoxin--NADP(+) reductase n=1 Tax=Phytohabitans suffuscus TaxID=624315 RepID=A0A6F8YR60_9ACTN|nr:FAD-dependent oxidoreductase [Phytohabitans suffuscus]BCB88637.1 NADP oxidoreductase [Phytohabitans suffuscus]
MSDPKYVAVVGAGPSGLYAAATLVSSDQVAGVDVLERLPAPYGLVRYGVAPDHRKTKEVVRILQRPFGDGGKVRFLGNVHIGDGGVPLARLREHYQAIIHATGCPSDRDLGVPGERLAGSVGSAAMVGWYSGHPDHAGLAPSLDHTGAVVVGAGNVALDIARVLSLPAEALAATDIPDSVLDHLAASRVRNVHILIRRGPQDVKFTPVELRQLGELDGVDIVVHRPDLVAAAIAASSERREQVILSVFAGWAARATTGADRRIHLHFRCSPTRLEGENGRVRGVVVRSNDAGSNQQSGGGTGRLAAGLVVRAIGYLGKPVDGLPFDASTGTVPNDLGRVNGLPGNYVTGWLRRGPSGVIGTNRADGGEVAAAVLQDLPALPEVLRPGPDPVLETFAEYGLEPVDWQDWLQLDAGERQLGQARGADRVKVAEWTQMLTLCRGSMTA